MSFDFRADQTRTGRIISSGSLPLLVYPSSSAANLAGGLTGFSTSSIGTDVFFYVSGSVAKKSVFGGDVKVSGSLIAGDISGSNPDALQDLGLGPGLFMSSSVALSNSLVLIDGIEPTADLGGLLLTRGAALTMFSGSVADNPGFSISQAAAPETVQVNLRGGLNVSSGSVAISVFSQPVKIYSGSSTSPNVGLLLSRGAASNQIVLEMTGTIQADKVTSQQITGSVKTVDGINNFIAAHGITANYNSTGQWEISGAFRQVSIANYSRTNLVSASVIGYAYFDPSLYPSSTTLGIEAVGMNMGGVSGGLGLYSQNAASTVATLSWSGTSTLTTGSYQYATVSLPVSATSYELHLSQSGGSDGGSSYTSVGFVNFHIS